MLPSAALRSYRTEGQTDEWADRQTDRITLIIIRYIEKRGGHTHTTDRQTYSHYNIDIISLKLKFYGFFDMREFF